MYMKSLFALFVFVLFFLLTPGILITLPRKSSKMTVALVHGLIFAVLLSISGHFFSKFEKNVFEGLTPSADTRSNDRVGPLDKPKSVSVVVMSPSMEPNRPSPGSTPGNK